MVASALARGATNDSCGVLSGSPSRLGRRRPNNPLARIGARLGNLRRKVANATARFVLDLREAV